MSSQGSTHGEAVSAHAPHAAHAAHTAHADYVAAALRSRFMASTRLGNMRMWPDLSRRALGTLMLWCCLDPKVVVAVKL